MSVAACAEIVRRGDPDRFLATMAARPEVRQRLFPLYAMNVEVARAPWLTAEPLIAEMRLQWWLDALEDIAQGRPVRAHEVTTPLSAILSPGQAARLTALIEARRWDIGRDGFDKQGGLSAHIETTAGLLASVASELLRGDGGAARDAGFAQGAAAWIKAVPWLIAQGRRPLPGDAAASLRSLAEEGLSRLDRARRAQGSGPSTARAALWVAFEAPVILARTARDPGRALAGDVGLSEFRRRARLLGISVTGRL